jgi:GT2 family glycosyltransferase
VQQIMDLSIIIVNWNSKEYLRKCLRSIEMSNLVMTFEVIVVDGASFDGCGEMLAREFPQVIFIQSPDNIGFGRANNLGFSRSQGNAILFLNPDTEIIGSAINDLHKNLCNLPGVGAVGARLLNTDLTLQTSCIMSYPTVLNQVLDSELLRNRFLKSKLWGIAPLYNNSNAPSQVEAISGACVMLKRDVCTFVKGFEERYFMYGEDVDLSFKVYEAGYKLYYVPTAAIVHHGGGSSRSARSTFSTVMMRESVQLFLRLRRGRISSFLYPVVMGIAGVARLFVCICFALLTRRTLSRETPSVKKWLAILRWSVGLERWASTAGSPK